MKDGIRRGKQNNLGNIRLKLLGLLACCTLGIAAMAQDINEVEHALGDSDYETILCILTVLAEQGNADVQFYLGEMYYYGYGVPRDDEEEAMRWYRMAAEQGDLRALYQLDKSILWG